MNEASQRKHFFSSANREGISIEGVSDVISFDESGVMMETLCGSMAVEGEGLHITVLDLSSGKIEIEGRLNSLYYFENRPTTKKGLFGKRND